MHMGNKVYITHLDSLIVINQYNNFEEFSAKASELGLKYDLTKIKKFRRFTQITRNFMIFAFHSFEYGQNIYVILTKNACVVYPAILPEKQVKHIKNEKEYEESTKVAYWIIKYLLKDYTSRMDKIVFANEKLSAIASQRPTQAFDLIEERTLEVRRFVDIVDSLLTFIVRAEERDTPQIRTEYMGYDFKILKNEFRLLLDRARNERRELNILINRCDIVSSTELNKSIVRLTKITAVLAIAALVISVPNTIATIFGVPTLAALVDHWVVVALLVITTLVSMVVGYFYLKAFLE